MPSFKPKANKKIMVSKKSNVTVDSKHQEKMNEFKNIEEVIIPKLQKDKQKYKKQLKQKNITLDKKLELEDMASMGKKEKSVLLFLLICPQVI